MVLVGFHFTKLHVEKGQTPKGEIKSKAHAEITKVQEAKLMGTGAQKGIEFTFRFSLVYEPGVGNMEFTGAVVYMGTADKVKTILDKWNKEKKLTKDVVEEVYNLILHKCNVEALILGQTMALPAHIKLPRVSAK